MTTKEYIYNLFDKYCTPFDNPESAVHWLKQNNPNINASYSEEYILKAFKAWSEAEILDMQN